jgi:hypothetical protein
MVPVNSTKTKDQPGTVPGMQRLLSVTVVWDSTSLFKGRYVTVQVMSATLVIQALLALKIFQRLVSVGTLVHKMIEAMI